MTVVDCFTFSDELDMLECRLTELADVVDWFVLVEAAETFQGAPKPLHYADNRERFARWRHRIIHVVATLPTGDPWTREAAQREAIAAGLDRLNLNGTDTIVLSDVDEIWHPAIAVADLPEPFAVLIHTMYVHHFGWTHPDPWNGAVVCKVRNLPPAQYGTFQTLRSCRLHDRPVRVPAAGWHLTYFGGADAAKAKQASFSHTEFADVDIAACAREGRHIDGTPLWPCSSMQWATRGLCEVPRFASTVREWWP